MPLVFFAMIVLAAAVPTSSAIAQARKEGTQKEPAGYRDAIDTALQEMGLGNYEEAREQFARAHALSPNARTLRGLGITEFELRHYLTAVGHLEEALASSVKPLEGSLRRETEALLARARSYVGELVLSVSPPSARTLVDGTRTIDNTTDPVLLDIGDHVLEFRAEGYVSERREVTVRGGQAQQLTIALAKLRPEAAPVAHNEQPPYQTPVEAPRSERKPAYKSWWLWTVVGVVVAGATVGTALAITMKNEKEEYRGVPTDNTPPGAGLSPWRF